jgi:hypothetical protein
VQPICACFAVTHFHKLFSPFWLPEEIKSGLKLGNDAIFGAEYFVFRVAIQKLEVQDI